jgi:hypothetical protein
MRSDRLTELLHELTQKGYIITFSSDFKGMITIAAYKEGMGENVALGHWHVGIPYGPIKDLDRAVRNQLASLEEDNE